MESSFQLPSNSNSQRRRNRYADVRSFEQYEGESRVDWNIVIPCFFIGVAFLLIACVVFKFVEHDITKKGEITSINTRLEALQARIDLLETSVANLSAVSPNLFQFDEYTFVSEFEKALNLASATNKKSEPTDLPPAPPELLQKMLNLYSPTYWQRFLDFYTSLYGFIVTILAASASFWIVCFLYYGIDATLASIVIPIGKTTRRISNFCNCMHFMIILESAKDSRVSINDLASKIHDIIISEDTAIYIYDHIMSCKSILIKQKSPIMMMFSAISDPTTCVEFLMNLRHAKKADLFIKSHRDGDLLEKIVLNLKNHGSMDEKIVLNLKNHGYMDESVLKDETTVQLGPGSNPSVACSDLKANASVTVKIE